jgi:hypothetical protein
MLLDLGPKQVLVIVSIHVSSRMPTGYLLPDDMETSLMRHGVDGFSPSSWEPQEEGMMSTATSFSLGKKPRFIVSKKKPNSRR